MNIDPLNFLGNAKIHYVYHPRFGMTGCMLATRDISKGEEILLKLDESKAPIKALASDMLIKIFEDEIGPYPINGRIDLSDLRGRRK